MVRSFQCSSPTGTTDRRDWRTRPNSLKRPSAFIAASDTGYAKSHGLENMPLMTIGKANGRLKTGLHVQAAGDPATRVGLTVQQVMGVSMNSWGADSMATSKTISEVLA